MVASAIGSAARVTRAVKRPVESLLLWHSTSMRSSSPTQTRSTWASKLRQPTTMPRRTPRPSRNAS